MISETYNICTLKYMRSLPDNFFDLLIADPRYFDGPNKRKFYGSNVSATKVKRANYSKNDNWKIPTKAWLKEAQRVSKHQIIFGINYMPFIHTPGRIIWDKCNGKSSFSDCEIASCSYHYSVRLFRFMWNGMMQGKSISEGHIQRGDKSKNQKRISQCEKPFEIFRWIFYMYLPNGGKVYDSHMGSGACRIAAYDHENIDYYGTDIDTIIFNKQEKRYQKHISQKRINFNKK